MHSEEKWTENTFKDYRKAKFYCKNIKKHCEYFRKN